MQENTAIYDGPKLVSVGSVTVQPGTKWTLGEVVEVKYLYVKAEGGRLYQPAMIGKRTDIDPSECTLSQIKLTGGI